MRKTSNLKHFVLFLLVLLASLGTVSPSYAQQKPIERRVTLNVKDVTAQSFFNTMHRLTGLDFIYSTDLVKSLPHVTVKADNQPASSVLSKVISGLNCRYDVNGNIVTITRRLASARTRTVTGYVYDESGEPLPGVSICIDDSKVCTITDSKGFYSLKVPESHCQLRYSFLGMSSAVVNLPKGHELLTRNVTMENDNTLNEVVVTGYQDIAKPKMTGSATAITADKLTERYNVNIVSALEGQVAGLSTYGNELKVRGTSSLYATTTPLLVVDGLPTEGRLEDLNQFNIQSITVLKDAAATAIYGARASNGVIVVTTKNANKPGKVEIDFTANLSIADNQNVDYNDNYYMNAEQQVAKESAYYDYLYANNKEQATSFLTNAMHGINAISPLEYGYYRRAIGEITDADLTALKQKLSKNNYAKEYADNMYRNQVMQEYNLALRTRSANSAQNFTVNFKHDNSGRVNAFDKRVQLDYKGSFDITKWLTARANVNLNNANTRSKGTDYSSYDASPWRRPAYESFYNEDGSIHSNYGWYDGNELFDQTLKPGTVSLASNPVDELYNNVVNTNRNGWRFHGELLVKPFDGLTLSAQGVYEKEHSTRNWLVSSDSHAARVVRNAYATVDDEGNVTYPVMETGGFKQVQNTDGRYWTLRGQATFDKTFGDHSITAIAGLEFRETKTTGTNSLLLGYDDQLQTANTITTNLLDLYNQRQTNYFMDGYPAQQFAFEPYLAAGLNPVTEVKHRYASGFANFTYTYKERYNIFGSWRKDYADVYGLNAKYRGKPLWSLGAAWNMEQEDFMKGITWINSLKPRLSYGSTGNIYQGATSYLTASTGKLNSYSKLPYAYISSPANPELTWEKTQTINFGVDFSLLDNRVRGAIDYYHKKSSDVFSYRTLDPTTGFTSMFVNAADVKNDGVELQVSADWFRPVTRQTIGWSTSFTMAYNRNKVTKVDNPAQYAYALIDVPFKKGYPTSAVWSYRFAGIDDGTYGNPGQTLWYGNDNTISHGASSASPDVLEYSGQTEPKINMGMDNRVMWNGFSLSLMMVYYGGHVMRTHIMSETFAGTYGPVPYYFIDSWDPDTNPDSKVPGWGQYSSTALGSEPRYGNNSVYKADFLKIRNIVLGYDFPQEWMRKIHVNKAHLQFQINNPGFIWRNNDINVDPETLTVSVPTSYVFTLNVNL